MQMRSLGSLGFLVWLDLELKCCHWGPIFLALSSCICPLYVGFRKIHLLDCMVTSSRKESELVCFSDKPHSSIIYSIQSSGML